MTSDELYLAISELVDKNSKEMEYHLDKIDASLRDELHIMKDEMNIMNDRMNIMNDRVNAMCDELNGKIDILSKDIHNIQLRLENIIEPRLQNIEACYTSTFERYSINVERFDRMQLDIDVLKSVVRKHDQLLCPQTA